MTLNILLLCNRPHINNDASTIVDHIDAIAGYSKYNVRVFSNLGHLPDKLDLERFDVLIIHYSISLLYGRFLSNESKQRIRDYTGLKVVFVQDEYRQINKMIDALAFLRVDVLFTCFPEHEMDRIYTKVRLPTLSKYTNLTGYIPEHLLQKKDVPAMSARTTHLGYRGRDLPYWLGALAYEKKNIVDLWQQHTSAKNNICVDLSYAQEDRLYGKKWTNFLSSCKATLGVESGSSVMDFTGELETIIDKHQAEHPDDSFEKVQALYLLDHEDKYQLNQISPRCFEAIALKTVLVLFEGEYSKVLVPNRHYIMLKKDFSNVQEVIAHLKDDAFLTQMAETAYNEVAGNPALHYQGFMQYVDNILESECAIRNKLRQRQYYTNDTFHSVVSTTVLKNKFYQGLLRYYAKLPQRMRLTIKLMVVENKFTSWIFCRLFPN